MGDGMGHAYMVGMVGHSNIWWGWSLGVGLAQMVGMVGDLHRWYGEDGG